MCKILVTGGVGYIGSHTIIELYNAGYEVVIVDNLSNSSKKVLKRINDITNKTPTFYELDLLDEKGLHSVFKENEISGVIHFAGLKSVGESNSSPLKYYRNNLVSTINLCEIMKEYGVKNLVFSSSATVYSTENSMPVSEDGILKASNPYGRTKLFNEQILHDLFESDNSWKITILRYFNPVGAHESGLIGESPNEKPNNLMPYITNVAVGNLEKLMVFGGDYDTKDGTGVRDFIHVTDLAKGHVTALQRNNEVGVFTYNMGTGKGYSVLEIVENFENVTGVNIPYEITERRLGDIPVSFASVTKSSNVLGWEAEKGIKDMCQDAWNWQRNNPNGFE